MSVYDLSPHAVGQFDKHLVRAPENLWHATNALLISETAIYPLEKLLEPFEHPVAGPGQLIHSFVYVENPPDTQEPVYDWLLANVGWDDNLPHPVGRNGLHTV